MRENEDNEIPVNEFSWAEGSRSNCFVVGKNTRILPSAFYAVYMNSNDGSYYYVRQTVHTDELIFFKKSMADEVITEIDKFWNNKHKFKENGFLQRRGYLFYGPPGTGKTALTEQIVSKTIKDGGIAFMCKGDPEDFANGLVWFRKYEPDRPIVCLFEDLDSIVDRYGESELLSCLDGENQVNYVLNIATTNYPEKLDKRLVHRPRRFDRIVKVGFPDEKIRTEYFTKKLKISPTEVKRWVKLTKNFSFAAMTDLVINVKCFDYSLEESVKKVASTLEHTANSKED